MVGAAGGADKRPVTHESFCTCTRLHAVNLLQPPVYDTRY